MLTHLRLFGVFVNLQHGIDIAAIGCVCRDMLLYSVIATYLIEAELLGRHYSVELGNEQKNILKFVTHAQSESTSCANGAFIRP